MVVETNLGTMTAEHLLDELTYRNYSHNRTLGISPDGFRKMGFPHVDAMEARYMREWNTGPDRKIMPHRDRHDLELGAGGTLIRPGE